MIVVEQIRDRAEFRVLSGLLQGVFLDDPHAVSCLPHPFRDLLQGCGPFATTASPQALEINGYHRRRAERAAHGLTEASPAVAVQQLVEITSGVPLVGMNPGFDVRFLTPLLARFGRRSEWHYSPLDCKSFIAGALRIPPPWRSEELARAIGIDPAAYGRHGALDDCRYTRDCYDRVLALPVVA